MSLIPDGNINEEFVEYIDFDSGGVIRAESGDSFEPHSGYSNCILSPRQNYLLSSDEGDYGVVDQVYEYHDVGGNVAPLTSPSSLPLQPLREESTSTPSTQEYDGDIENDLDSDRPMGIPLRSIIGLTEEKTTVMLTLLGMIASSSEPEKSPSPQARPSIKPPLAANLLLYGPPGTGKTLLVHSICHELSLSLLSISPSSIWRGVVGESEGKIKGIFDLAYGERAECEAIVDANNPMIRLFCF